MGSVYFIIFFLTVSCSLAWADEKCVYHHLVGNDTYVTCTDGCCYEWVHPCCDYFYNTVWFKLLMAFNVVTLVLCIVAIVIRYKIVKERRNQRRVLMSTAQRRTISTVPVIASGKVNSSFPAEPSASLFNPNYQVTPPVYSTIGAAPPPYREQENHQ